MLMLQADNRANTGLGATMGIDKPSLSVNCLVLLNFAE